MAELVTGHKSLNTVRNYRADLTAFLRYYQGPADKLTAAILRTYFQLFASLVPAAQARHRASLKSFLKWLLLNEYLLSNPMDKLGPVKVPDRQPRPIPEQDVERLLKQIGSKRDRLLFTLIYETGLRISKALNIRVESIRLDAQEITVMGERWAQADCLPHQDQCPGPTSVVPSSDRL